MREAFRYRKSLIEERARELNRLQKMLEGANIKLSSFTSDINNKSSRRILNARLEGKKLDEKQFQELHHGSMHKKISEIMKAQVTMKVQANDETAKLRKGIRH